MSNGGSLSYHLRPNKTVERAIFVDLLRRLDLILKIGKRYQYISLGGPQMEDFRLVHEHFQKMKMLCLEENSEVIKRQKFNSPHSRIAYQNQTSTGFFSDYTPSQPDVVWLDFTMPGKRSDQIADLQKAVGQVLDLSIVKITMNAAAASLGGDPNRSDFHTERLNRFKADFGDFFPERELVEEDIMQRNFPATLLQLIASAASETLTDHPEQRFQPLTFAVYADGQTMITATGLVGDRHKIRRAIIDSDLRRWDFARLSWLDAPVEIDVPDLTLKERICINQLLPRYENNVNFVQRKLRCCVDSDPSASEVKLRNYVKFKRLYPHFAKVAI